MDRPDIEQYEQTLNGAKGRAMTGFMEHVGMRQLLSYVRYLESCKSCTCKEE